MKQIIINVDGLTIEEKQRVNEALAKITGAAELPAINPAAVWFFAPATSGSAKVTWGSGSLTEKPTHTPQQVLEMAGMVPSANQHVFLADSLIITDSSGSIIYDSTPKEEKKGHVHAELIAQYAEDAKTNVEPWMNFQLLHANGTDWLSMKEGQGFHSFSTYRRKPKMKLIHGTEVPDLSFTPLNSEDYYYICLSSDQLVLKDYHSEGCMTTKLRAVRGLCYPYTGEGKQAAILHAEALLNID